MSSLLALGWALLAAAGHQERWKVDFKASLSEKEGKWVYAVEGTTNLPPETVLRARVYVLSVVDDPIRGPREDDDEALVRADDPVRPSFVKFKAGKGDFRVDVHSFQRKPYSIRYRAKVFYVPHDQADAIALKVGDEGFERKADLRVGSDAAYEAELKACLAEATKDLMSLERLESLLSDWAARAASDPQGWKVWKQMVLGQVASIQERNDHRFDLWSVYPESQTRFRVGGLCDVVGRIIASIDAQDGAALRRWIPWFERAIDEAYTVLGIDAPLDERRAVPAFAAYERTMTILRGGIDRPEIRRRARAEGVAALFDLLKMIRTRDRAYVYVNALSVRFTRIFHLVEAEASREDLNAALESHDAALREFRSFAGLR